MQRSARAWAALEGIRSQAAVASVWRRACGHFYAAFSSAVLQLAAEPATLYPCPERSGYPHTICRRDDGSIVAQPQAEDCGCRPVALTAADIAVWELSWPKASRVLREALGLAACRAELGLYNTRQIGLWLTGGSPVLLTVQTDPYDFQRTVEGLIARLRGGFILLSPTCGLVDVVSRSLLASANAGFFPLDTTVFFTEGGLVQPRQRPGELFSAFTPQPTAPTDEDTARKVYAVLSAFKTDPKFDRPTVMDVFESYCRGEGRSVAQVAHDYSCSRLTVLRRLKIIRAQTGRDPRDLRRYSSYFEKIREEMADSRAARIHRGTMDH